MKLTKQTSIKALYDHPQITKDVVNILIKTSTSWATVGVIAIDWNGEITHLDFYHGSVNFDESDLTEYYILP